MAEVAIRIASESLFMLMSCPPPNVGPYEEKSIWNMLCESYIALSETV